LAVAVVVAVAVEPQDLAAQAVAEAVELVALLQLKI
jgi:hypothetical protein